MRDAKARFSEFLDDCLTQFPRWVNRRGAEAAVLAPVDESRRLTAAARPSLKSMLLVEGARDDAPVPDRSPARRRKVTAAR
jgi:prevent-host-death family protein